MSELQRLRDRVEELLGMGEDDVSLIRRLTGITKTKPEMVGVLRESRRVLRKEALLALVYDDRPECDQPELKIIDVQGRTQGKSSPAEMRVGGDFLRARFCRQTPCSVARD
jgi:hypothetical protein